LNEQEGCAPTGKILLKGKEYRDSNYYVTWCRSSWIQTEVKVISFPFVRDVLQRDHIDCWDNAILD